MDDVVIMHYGKDSDSLGLKGKLAEAKINSAGFSSEEWEKKLQELKRDTAAWRAYLQSDEWKKTLEEWKKNSAGSDSYFESDEWKASEKALKEANDYFQSDEWKEAQQTLGEGFRFETETANGTKIIVVDGKRATEADLKALDGERIQSVNINKDKQPDGSVVSTITVTTKGRKRNKADKR